MLSIIGSITLNISFILYLFLYLPQIIHNQQKTHIAELSFSLHLLLYASYFFDLFYGFSNHFPWQYKTVSLVGLVLVSVQHLQLLNFFKSKQEPGYQRFCYALFFFNVLALYWFFVLEQSVLSAPTTAVFGAIARICGLIYCLPQIQKNKKAQSSKAMSLPFIFLNLTLAFLDTISAWCLDWGWSNKLASPLTVLFMFILLSQNKKYLSKEKDTYENSPKKKLVLKQPLVPHEARH